MILKFYDKDPNKQNSQNQNATLPSTNLSADLWTEDGKYKASLSTLIEFEADSWFSDSYELVVVNGETETKLIENTDYFLGDSDVELGSNYPTALGVKLNDTPNVRLARTGSLILRAWVARQNLKAKDMNEILAVIRSISG